MIKRNIVLRNLEYSDYCYSFYISYGYLISCLAHIYAYQSRGLKTLLSFLNAINISTYQVVMQDAYLYSIITSCLYMLLFTYTIKCKKYDDTLNIFKVGLVISIIFAVNILLYVVSIINFVYELFYSLIVFIGLIIDKEFIHNKKYCEAELWDLIKVLLPICISFPLLMAGGGLIAAFYSSEREVVRIQLYRHVGLAVYFEIGAFTYIISPIIKKLFLIRKGIVYEYQVYGGS